MNLLKRIIEKVTRGHSRSVAVKKNIVASFALKGVSMLVSFLLVPATIGYVSSELYGVWLTLSSVLVWMQFLDIGFSQGLKNRLTEALAHKEMAKAKSLVSTTYAVMAAIFIPVSIIGSLLVPYIDWCYWLNVDPVYQHQIIEVMEVLIFLFCTQMVVNVIVSVMAAYQQVAFSQSFMVIGNVLAFIVIIVLTKTVPPSLLPLSLTLAGAPILVTVIGSTILFTTKYRAVAPSIKSVDFKYIRDLFSLGVKFFIINIQVVVVFQSTNFLLSYVSSPEVVTSYNIAYKYLSLAMFLYTNITIPLWPAYTDAYAKGDTRWMKETRAKMNKILAACAALCIVFAIIAQPVYSIWIGNRAHVPATMTWMVTIYVIVYCFMNLNGTFIVGIGKIHLESIFVFIGMIVYIPMALLFAKAFDEYGILIALILLNMIYGILFLIQTNKILDGKARGIWNR